MDTTQLLTTVAAILAAAVVYFHIKKFSYWSSRGVKGPIPWPIWGTNIYYLFENKLKVDARWAQQYGKVYGLYEGYSPLLRVHDRELVNLIYIKQFPSFTDRHSTFIYDKVQQNWLLWVRGNKWSARRALVSPQFSSAKMRLMSRDMSGCINRFLEEIEKRSMENNCENERQKETLVEKTDIMSLALDVIGTNFFSLKQDTYRSKGNEFLQRAFGLAQFDIARFFVWSLLPRAIAKAISFDLFHYSRFEYFDLLAKKLIRDRRTNRKEKEAPQKLDILQALLDARLKNNSLEEKADFDDEEVALYSGHKGEKQHAEVLKLNTKPMDSLDDLDIRGQMSFLMTAGFETTATTISFCAYELAHQPHMQEAILDELRRTFKEETALLASKDQQFPEELYSKLMDLTLLNAFISESMRVYSPILENTRLTTEPIVLPANPPIKLPVGIPISTNTFILQRDPDYWPEPDKFDHTRFLPENRDKILQGSYMPFGLGSRHCLGMRFALLEVKMVIAKILLNHHILPGTSYPPSFEQNPIFLVLKDNNFKLKPRNLELP